ncbi:glucosamine 6-phosphate N-acetyltransferase-like [Convolutriloba macropyga]|uniref:glucosamine 6-phosphate N-acetyltransferase-like n=1 Tax=Convolutriloba macropyga TaxID=536237 RepID=UPI003F51CDFE
MDQESAIYDPKILHECTPHIEELESLAKNFQLRPLEPSDFAKGYCELLKQLTSVGEITYDQFLQQFNSMKASKDSYLITVVEDLTEKRIVGTTTVVTELKFIHNVGKRARIEDVVVDQSYRGKGLAKVLVKTAIEIAAYVGAYKLSLECTDDLIPFYTKCGLSTNKNHYMEMRF